MAKEVPFFANTTDGTHCFQASLAMALAYFKPETTFTFEELDKISNKAPGKWTWPTAAMLWMLDNGFELRLIEDFDYDDFAKRGADYIIDRCGKDVAEAQIKHSIIERELEYAKKFAKLNMVERRLPDFDDISKLLNQGFLVMCNVNAPALYKQPGYSGHFILIHGCKKDYVVIHDTGLPPRPSYKVLKLDFYNAWAYPTDNERNLLAVRLKRSK